MARGKVKHETGKSGLLMYKLDMQASHLVLSREEVEENARLWQQTGDRKYQDKLIRSCLRWAVKLAHRYAFIYNQEHNILDLIQEANLGLIQATEDFDYTQNSFVGWSKYWIKKNILEYLVNNVIVRITANSLATKKKVDAAKKDQQTEGQPTEQIDIKELIKGKISEKTLAQVEQWLATEFVSSSEPLYTEEGEDGSIEELISAPDRRDIEDLFVALSGPKINLQIERFLEDWGEDRKITPRNVQVLKHLFNAAIRNGRVNLRATAQVFDMTDARVDQLHKRVMRDSEFVLMLRTAYPMRGQQLLTAAQRSPAYA